jgi:4-amino-4-deoxy-L-arabinose transferase-like glycosyltransferase
MLRHPRLLWILLVIGALLRAVVIELRPAGALEMSPDESRYLDIAHSLTHGQGFRLNGEPTAYNDPLFPAVASVMIALFGGSVRGMLYFQIVLGCAAAVLLYEIGRKRFGSSAGLLLAGAWLFYPGAVIASALFLSITLHVFLWIAALLLYDRLIENGFRISDALLLGLCAGLVVLTRAIGLVLLAAIVIRLCQIRYGAFQSTHWRGALLVLFAAAIIVVPWMARNAATVGHFVLNTNGGFGIFTGESAQGAELPPGEVSDAPSLSQDSPPAVSAEVEAGAVTSRLWWRKVTRLWASDAALWTRYFHSSRAAARAGIHAVLPIIAASLPVMVIVGSGVAGFLLVPQFPLRSLLLLQLALLLAVTVMTYGVPRDHFSFLPALLIGAAALWRPAVWSGASLRRRAALILALGAVSGVWLLEGLILFDV